MFLILDEYLPPIKERSVVVITSKIVAICEGRIANPKEHDKDQLIMKEAEYYLPRSSNRYNVLLTIKNNTIIASSGIDESNANGYLILWPKYPQQTANNIRKYLLKRFQLKNVGVVITDSRLAPLRRGTIGVSIGYSGFAALHYYIGEKDIFGRKFEMQVGNIADELAVSAVLAMGEGSEQTPIAIVEDVPFVKFQKRDPSAKELRDLHISLEDDIFAPVLTATKWRKGGMGKG